ncbi:sensor domain-containing diguanylate cyclase [Aquabacterium sp. A7-Y]|uniref:sensor domain-containing diguanylate cyclase n=1 Tax=Aquabacterium sp. A7-Y TaxID=1349605 RepID=UPI00223DBA2A|nr:diguanylate cyclase [Aquabacterium sp. A7-Y]MCW7541530.1 sensor domain-containing diguanylate cyclase [Aquabacterium sp. A7-Y]
MLLYLLRWVACALALAAAAPALALSAGASPGVLPVSVAGTSWPRVLSADMEVLEDREGRLELSQVRALPGERWSSTGGHALNPGFSSSVWWIRLRLYNPQDLPAQRLLELAHPLHDDVQAWLVRPDVAHPQQHWHTGDRHPFATRPLDYRTFLFPMTLEGGGYLEVYLRIATHDGLHEAAELQLWDHRNLIRDAERLRFAFGLYYGALLALLLYNLFLYASTHITLYAHYVVYLGAFFVWNFSFRGFAFQHWWPAHPWWANQALPVMAACAFVTHGFFAMRYLQTRTCTPRLHRGLRAMQAINILCLLPGLAGWYGATLAVQAVVGCLGLLLHIFTGAVLLFRGSRPARYYLLAWTVLAVGIILYLLRMAALLPATPVTEHVLQVGSVLEFLLLAFGLADRMKQLEDEKVQAERAALEARAALTEQLESQVQERTRALEAANRLLAEMAITDELTGAYNRRHFNEVYAPELRRQARSCEGFALALLDLDHFKAYNDRYGHQQGDRALQAVSSAVRTLLKRSGDAFFRLGGEEFAVMMQARQPDAAQRFLESVCECVAELELPHEGSPHGRVTISAGLVFLSPHGGPHDPQTVFARADALLYQAKAAGRNTVASAVL